jgi:alpha-tubulin suppressor-like RCC1 family protein
MTIWKFEEPTKRTTMNAKRNLIQICLLCAMLFQAAASGGQTVTNIAAGFDDSLFLKSDGSLWAMGYNNDGQLGDGMVDGTFNSTNRPEQIVATNVTAIAANSHSLFLKSDGSLWGMGYNGDGELGDGTINNTNRPERIVITNVTAIVASSGHSLFLKSDGSLWGMGFNGDGSLGDGTFTSTNRPEQIVATNVTAIAAGDNHTLFLKRDGSLWAMGRNVEGQLGDGTFSSKTAPTGPNRLSPLTSRRLPEAPGTPCFL